MIKSTITEKVIPALFKVKKTLRPMVKDSSNPFFKSKYLELSDILSNLEPILHAEGLFLTQATILRDGKTIVVSEVTHAESGEFVASEFPAEVASADPQKLGSAVSYARRYGVQSLFSLNVVDDDGNSASGKGSSSGKTEAHKASSPAIDTPKGGFRTQQPVKDLPTGTKEIGGGGIDVIITNNTNPIIIPEFTKESIASATVNLEETLKNTPPPTRRGSFGSKA